MCCHSPSSRAAAVGGFAVIVWHQPEIEADRIASLAP